MKSLRSLPAAPTLLIQLKPVNSGVERGRGDWISSCTYVDANDWTPYTLNAMASMNRKRDRAEGHRAGFTLVELIVTLVLIGILAAISAPALNGAINRADARSTARGVANQLRLARNLAMSRGEVMLAEINPATERGQVKIYRTRVDGSWADPPKDPLIPATDCVTADKARSTASDRREVGSPVEVSELSGDMKMALPGGAARQWLCFSPDGRILNTDGQVIYDSECTGKNFRLFVSHLDQSDIKSIHTKCPTSQTEQRKQTDQRALDHFWTVEAPYNGAIRASQ